MKNNIDIDVDLNPWKKDYYGSHLHGWIKRQKHPVHTIGPNPTLAILVIKYPTLPFVKHIREYRYESPKIFRSFFSKNDILNNTKLVIFLSMLKYTSNLNNELVNTPGMLQQL